MSRFQNSICLFAASLLLTSCAGAGLMAGIGAKAGIAASQEGGISAAWTDTTIQAEINNLWFEHDVEMFRKIDMTVKQGRVLLTGVVQNPEHRVEAVRLAWQPKGVKQVINEIRVAEDPGISRYARDAWISTRLRTALTFDKDVQSINYNIDTVDGIIYLMGVAQSQAELNRVMEIARTIPDVKQVVSYIKMAGEQGQDFTPANTTGVAAVPPAVSSGAEYQEAPGAPTPLTGTDYQSPAGAAVPAPVESEPLGGGY